VSDTSDQSIIHTGASSKIKGGATQVGRNTGGGQNEGQTEKEEEKKVHFLKR